MSSVLKPLSQTVTSYWLEEMVVDLTSHVSCTKSSLGRSSTGTSRSLRSLSSFATSFSVSSALGWAY